jgi:hypothetical protein
LKSKLGKLAKLGFILGFAAFASMYVYGFFEMEGRTKLNQQDTLFLGSMVGIIGVSIILILIDRAKTQGGHFSWKKFGIILLIVILFGLWRIAV